MKQYCDCLDIKYNNMPKEEVACILPQPNPNCPRCKGTGFEEPTIMKYAEYITVFFLGMSLGAAITGLLSCLITGG